MSWRADPTDPTPSRPPAPAWYTSRVELVLYLLAGLTYVGFAIFHKWLLNWIIGPVWLVAWIWFAPAVVDAVLRRGRR